MTTEPTFHDLLVRRRSIRHYTDDLLSPQQTHLILSAALLSPSSKNQQACEFIAIDDKDQLALLSNCKVGGATFVDQAALAVVVIANPLLSDVWIEDAAVAATNMQMQAEALGIGSCWVQIRERMHSETLTSAEYVNDILDIPMPMQPVCLITFGMKKQAIAPHNEEELKWEKIHVGKY